MLSLAPKHLFWFNISGGLLSPFKTLNHTVILFVGGRRCDQTDQPLSHQTLMWVGFYAKIVKKLRIT